MEDLILLILSLIGSITLIVLMIKALNYGSNKLLAFRIIFSEGLYDVMLGNRRLVSQPTFEEAKQWLDEHKDSYRQKDKVVYKEKF